MSATVDVIVDRDDDIATVKAIHGLSARHPDVLAVHIAPGTREEPAAIWAILRALGKRIGQLQRENLRVWWIDAERWLTAHAVNEIVVLCAQHLGPEPAEELKRNVGGLGIALTLIYGRPVRTMPAATTTLTAFLARERQAAEPRPRGRPWPRVPRSHPLRLRYDCSQRLTRKDFTRMERLLAGSFRAVDVTASLDGFTAKRPGRITAINSDSR